MWQVPTKRCFVASVLVHQPPIQTAGRMIEKDLRGDEQKEGEPRISAREGLGQPLVRFGHHVDVANDLVPQRVECHVDGDVGKCFGLDDQAKAGFGDDYDRVYVCRPLEIGTNSVGGGAAGGVPYVSHWMRVDAVRQPSLVALWRRQQRLEVEMDRPVE